MYFYPFIMIFQVDESGDIEISRSTIPRIDGSFIFLAMNFKPFTISDFEVYNSVKSNRRLI